MSKRWCAVSGASHTSHTRFLSPLDRTGWLHHLKIAHRHTVVATDEVVCLYRIHAGNMTASFGVRIQQEILGLLDE